VREGTVVALAGVIIGIPAAMLATRAIGSMLFHVGPWDPIVFGGAAAVLFICVCTAAFIPAWRATRVQPSESLRTS
jgi:ABC-type antimicrobial peptide transport system permease subunit